MSGQATRSQAKWVLTGVGLFGCLLLGVIALLLHSSVAKHRDAERRFRPVQATILTSRLHSEKNIGSKEKDGFLHRPLIRFAYEVNGRRFESDRYAFDETSSSDPRYAETVTGRYPSGRSVTAWYDPDRPEVAILETAAPGTVTMGFLFLRPFWAMALLILFHGAWTWLLDVHTKRYLERPHRVPCRIPGWGRLRRVGSGHAITRRPHLVPWVMLPYLFATFLSLFILFFGGWEDDPRAQEISLAACLAVTAVFGLVGLLQGHRVRFLPDRMVVERPFRREEMPADDVASVEVGEARAAARPPKPLSLYLKAKDGRTLRLNVFSLSWDNAALASRARQQVEELLGLAPSAKSASAS